MHTKTAIVYDQRFKEHQTGTGHPESPARYDAVLKGIREAVALDKITKLEPSIASEEVVRLCHPVSYINTVKNDVASGYSCLSTGDTRIGENSMETAMLAVGALITATDAVIAKNVRNAFCNIRPPGHHATAERGMGFCIFNNIAIAARYAQQKYGIGNILIVDWDIHHGNGTQDIFYDDPTVFYFSTHSWPFYPGSGSPGETGSGKGKGFTMNCPFGRGAGRKEVIGAFNDKLVPAMKSFRPELVLISAGFDARQGDTIGNFLLSDQDFADLTGICMEIAANYAENRIVSALEGGYTLSGLAASSGSHVKTLSNWTGLV